MNIMISHLINSFIRSTTSSSCSTRRNLSFISSLRSSLKIWYPTQLATFTILDHNGDRKKKKLKGAEWCIVYSFVWISRGIIPRSHRQTDYTLTPDRPILGHSGLNVLCVPPVVNLISVSLV